MSSTWIVRSKWFFFLVLALSFVSVTPVSATFDNFDDGVVNTSLWKWYIDDPSGMRVIEGDGFLNVTSIPSAREAQDTAVSPASLYFWSKENVTVGSIFTFKLNYGWVRPSSNNNSVYISNGTNETGWNSDKILLHTWGADSAISNLNQSYFINRSSSTVNIFNGTDGSLLNSVSANENYSHVTFFVGIVNARASTLKFESMGFGGGTINVNLFKESDGSVVSVPVTVAVSGDGNQTVTESDGVIMFEDFPTGNYLFTASSDYFVTRALPLDYLSGDNVFLNFYLLNTTSSTVFNFYVRDNLDTLIEDADVTVEWKNGANYIPYTYGSTDFTGRFATQLDLAEQFRFTIEKAGYVSRTVELVPLDQDSFTIYLEPVTSLSFPNFFQNVVYGINPSSGVLSFGLHNFSLNVLSNTSVVDWFSVGSVFGSNQLDNQTSASGGTAQIEINVSNTTSFVVDYYITTTDGYTLHVPLTYAGGVVNNTQSSFIKAVGFINEDLNAGEKMVLAGILAGLIAYISSFFGLTGLASGVLALSSIVIMAFPPMRWVDPITASLTGVIVVGLMIVQGKQGGET